MSKILSTTELCKSFSHGTKLLKILKNVNFSIEEGEALAIVGASGAGKSTLLHLLGGLDIPSSGKIIFRDQDISTFNSDKLARYRSVEIGFVFQFHHLLPAFTAEENVMIPCLIRGISSNKARALAVDMLKRVGLSDRITHKPGQLSGGEQQRVSIARASIMKPSLLLADEPTGNLDSLASKNIHSLLMELNEEMGMTMVVVTHNKELANTFKRVVTMADGEIIKDESK